MNRLTEEEKLRGVVSMSAGNHAIAVAYHAQRMAVPATLVMPENTPIGKVEKTREYGASVILHGNTLAESRDFAVQLIKKNNSVLLHPFDDPDVIIGHGSVAIEMFQDVHDLDVLMVPVGGGGLASGVSVVAKAINPAIHIIGVQTLFCPAVAEMLFPNAVPLDVRKDTHTIAEGLTIQFPGMISTGILHDLLDDMIVVNESMIENAMESLIMHNKVIAEGSGATGVAAMMYNRYIFKNKRVGIMICGGNVDSRLLSNLLMRGLVHEGRLVRFKIEIDDSPGILGKLTHIIGKAGGNIFEISHQRLFNKIMLRMVYVNAVVETRDTGHANEICQALINGGFPAVVDHDSL